MSLTDRQKKTLKKHSVHHSKKHMDTMKSLMTRKKETIDVHYGSQTGT